MASTIADRYPAQPGPPRMGYTRLYCPPLTTRGEHSRVLRATTTPLITTRTARPGPVGRVPPLPEHGQRTPRRQHQHRPPRPGTAAPQDDTLRRSAARTPRRTPPTASRRQRATMTPMKCGDPQAAARRGHRPPGHRPIPGAHQEGSPGPIARLWTGAISGHGPRPLPRRQQPVTISEVLAGASPTAFADVFALGVISVNQARGPTPSICRAYRNEPPRWGRRSAAAR